MVSKAYRTCLLLIEKMVKTHPEAGFMDRVSKAELENLIVRHIGADERTIKKYTRVCVRCKLLEPHTWKKDEVLIYSINLVKADHEMREVFGHQLRQLQLES